MGSDSGFTTIKSDNVVSFNLLLQSVLINFIRENPLSASTELDGSERIRSIKDRMAGHLLLKTSFTFFHVTPSIDPNLARN